MQTIRQSKNNQVNGSKTEATLILCGYSGERANSRGDSTIKEEVRRRKMRKFADMHSNKEQSSKQSSGSNTEATLILCGYSGSRANKRGDRTIKEEVRRRKKRKFADKQTDKEQSDNQRTFQTLRPL